MTKLITSVEIKLFGSKANIVVCSLGKNQNYDHWDNW